MLISCHSISEQIANLQWEKKNVHVFAFGFSGSPCFSIRALCSLFFFCWVVWLFLCLLARSLACCCACVFSAFVVLFFLPVVLVVTFFRNSPFMMDPLRVHFLWDETVHFKCTRGDWWTACLHLEFLDLGRPSCRATGKAAKTWATISI